MSKRKQYMDIAEGLIEAADKSILVGDIVKTGSEFNESMNQFKDSCEKYINDPTDKNAQAVNDAYRNAAKDAIDVAGTMGEIYSRCFSR